MQFTRRTLLGAAAGAARAHRSSRLNVLFIAVDDLNTRLGCYGSVVKSPNIDALARRGLRFDRAYCQYPLCNPSRSSLLTGRRPPATGVWDNVVWFRDNLPEVITLPQYFKEHGYVTARTGKIFHGGMDDVRAWNNGGTPRQERRPPSPPKPLPAIGPAENWREVEGEGEDQPDHRTATRAIGLLEQLQGKPFFLAVGFMRPHVPLIAPRKYFDLYDAAKLRLPDDFAPAPAGQTPAYRANYDLFRGHEVTPELARRGIAAYYAAISFMDAQVGRLLAALDRLGLRDNTVISLFGDHGWHLGEKGMWSKMTLFEAGVRAPLILSVPRSATAGRSCARPVEFIDLYPTLADACGLPEPTGVEGNSLIPLVREPGAKWDKPAYSYLRRGKINGVSVRTERYRYTEWDEGREGTELYDHQNDSGENRNLAADPRYREVVVKVRKLLRG